MELIHHLIELQRSKLSRREAVVEDDAADSTEAAEVRKEGGASDEDLRGSILKELQGLSVKQAETETVNRGLSTTNGDWDWDGGGWEEEKDVGRYNEKEYTGNDQSNEWNGQSEYGDAGQKQWEYKNEYENGSNYPVRDDAEDCAFYMRSGSCKFGMNCKFNHPPRMNEDHKERGRYRDDNSEKSGKALCKFYTTAGWCRNGADCRYSHGSDKSSESRIFELNSLGYPKRPEEIECSYYKRTGSCKYGMNCRFNHPELDAVAGASSGSSNGAPQTSPLRIAELESQTSSTSERNEKKASFMDGRRSVDMQQQHNESVEEYPERPGEPECAFFIRTGDCKFKSKCKFHHPKNQVYKRKPMATTAPALNDTGLPIRPDQPICTQYYKYGNCNYGSSCRYDHSSISDAAEEAEADAVSEQ